MTVVMKYRNRPVRFTTKGFFNPKLGYRYKIVMELDKGEDLQIKAPSFLYDRGNNFSSNELAETVLRQSVNDLVNSDPKRNSILSIY